MINLKKIEDSPELWMALSELLFELIKPDECWHEWDYHGFTIIKGVKENDFGCLICPKIISVLDGLDPPYNSNLFTRSAFLDVFEAAEKMEDSYKFFTYKRPYSGGSTIFIKDIASPHFQLAVLKWLLEQADRGEELERVLSED